MQLSDITIYPIKSCAGFNVPATQLDRFGPSGDRRWMVVAPDGGFLTQRELPGMALLEVRLVAGGICLSCQDTQIVVHEPGPQSASRLVRVWGDSVPALDAGEDAAAWLSAALGRPCRLVHMPQDSVRMVDGAFASEGETVGFADGFPLLLISRSSLDELNSRLSSPVKMNRFRPNLVVTGCSAHAEDQWRRIRIGAVEFDVAKACSRCVIPSIIQESGQRDPHINSTLAGYRRFNGQILFGQNLLYQRCGTLSVGDEVEVLA